MIQTETQARGLALLCDLQGLIQKVLLNNLNLPEVNPGQLFLRIVDDASRTKAMNFLLEVKAQGAVLDWEINVSSGEAVIPLHFTAGRSGDSLLITAGTNGQRSARLYEDMLRINNEQADQLRSALKDKAEWSGSRPGNNEYDEISRLNNELVTMQRELSRKNAELKRLNDLKNQFLGMAAHDLRNPLQAILSYSDFLLDEVGPKLDASQVEFLTTIRDQSKYMAQLVNDLLDVSAIESGRLQLELQPVDLVKLAQTNLKRNRLIAARKNISLDLQTELLPPVLLDASKIEQVLDNLLTNAIKFSPPGSRVRVGLRPEGDALLLSVQDEGCGIPPEQMARLFQPFQRGQKGTRGEKSTGLGLTIVKRIVEGHGGRLWLESRVDVGTTFFVSLPLQRDEKMVSSQ